MTVNAQPASFPHSDLVQAPSPQDDAVHIQGRLLSQPIPSGKDSKDLELCLLGDSMSSQVDSQDELLLE